MTTTIQQEYDIPINNGDQPTTATPPAQIVDFQPQQKNENKADPHMIIVSIAGRQYPIIRKPIRQASEWRDKFKDKFGAVMAVFEVTQTVAGDDKAAMEAMNIGDMAEVAKNFVGLFLNSMDTVLEMVYEYSPKMLEDKDFIECNGYDEDIVSIFIQILQLAYPAGKLTALISGAFQRGTGKKSR